MTDSGKVTRFRFILITAVLISGAALINWLEFRGEAEIERRPLSEVPAELGEWRQIGSEIRFDEQTESVLKASDYTMREFELPDGRRANIYIGYYGSQRTGATYHSPQNCLPGAGWVMRDPDYVNIEAGDGSSFTANKFIVENGVYKEVLIYWYQGRGRFEASEYANKISTVTDSIFRRRSDGAMVRVMSTVGDSEDEATRAAVDLAANLSQTLSEFVPH